MNTEKMTVHKALAELKIIDSRIDTAIIAGTFVAVKKNNQDKISGKSVEDFKAAAKSDYDRASDLIKRRNTIKRAVTLSNAQTTVEIGGEKMTVVEAIDLKNNGMKHYEALRDALMLQLGKAKTTLVRNEQTAQALDLVARAEKWLRQNPLHAEVRKWNTEEWGEIPADFGRKK